MARPGPALVGRPLPCSRGFVAEVSENSRYEECMTLRAGGSPRRRGKGRKRDAPRCPVESPASTVPGGVILKNDSLLGFEIRLKFVPEVSKLIRQEH